MADNDKKLDDIYSDCGASEPYALQVTDDSMEPEFPKDCLVIIDPVGQCNNGQFVFIEYDGVRWFRKYIENKDGKYLISLNENYPEIILDNSYDVLGIIIQKNENRKIKHYK
tara:strand:- start:1120 stop:1455 length:336 start_codon:yes stop_codon:yes gene_type:complete